MLSGKRSARSFPALSRLGTHIIWRLSAIARHPIRSVVIEGDLWVLFRIDGNMVTTLNVGTHKIYRFDPTIAATAIGILAEPFASRRLAKNGLH